MTTIAYIANEFPSPVEPYVLDEINELRRRDVKVICCSGKRVAPNPLSLAERAFWKETRYFQPLTDDQLMRAARRLASDRGDLWQLLRELMIAPDASLSLRVRALGHSLMGSALAEQLAPLEVEHIHCHHGYFASWMALVAARLLGIDFSFTLHGSDLLHRADLLDAKLRACKFCVTVSEYNRQYLFRNYPATPAAKVLVQHLGVDPILPRPLEPVAGGQDRRPFCLLAVGRLHPVKDYAFLIQACGDLRSKGFDFICWIVGEGHERPALERQIAKLGLQGHVHLVGHVPRHEIGSYYNHADLVVMTSKSEGIPVVLMEAMAHGKLVLAPRITGIPELVEHQRTGFLYEARSLDSFVGSVRGIHSSGDGLSGIQRAAAAKVADSYDRRRNVRAFADGFMARISQSGGEYENSVLQQVRLSV
jgi:colanic acid/amylovoran biosynthesis glycosyltransferase